MWADVGTILLGSVLLLFGTDSLVNGVSGLLARRVSESYLFSLAGAIAAGLAPLLALVAAGLIVGQSGLAVGGIIGSAIAGLGLLLGLAALSAPLLARLKVFAWINPALIAAVILVWVLGIDHDYSAIDGAILLVAFVVVAILIGRAVSRERVAAKLLFDQAPPTFGPGLLLLRILVGLVLLGLGAWRLMIGSSGLAATLVVNPLIIGLLVLGPVSVLAGAPTAVLAARRGRGDFALGQALFGAMSAILLVLGAFSVIHPLAIPASMLRVELPVLLTLAVAIYPMMRSDGELSSREGLLLLLAYLAFASIEIWLTFV
jgi:cation:H+ antiporter